MATTIAEFLRAAGDGPSRRDIEVLLAAALGVQRSYLYAHGEQPLTGSSAQVAEDMLHRLRAGTPLAYIVGRREFRDLLLEVSPDVLIPRPETELLAELALQRLPPNGRVLDLGTGSGAIALAIKRARGDCDVTATDISERALAIARRNASTYSLDIDWRSGNWYSAVDGVFDVIAANPPYIAESDPHLDALVGEPRLALVGGADGLDALRIIIHGAPTRLTDQGWLLVEHGFEQGYAVRGLFDSVGLRGIETHRDLAENERVTLATR